MGSVIQLIMALWSLSRNKMGFTTSSSSVEEKQQNKQPNE